MKSFWLTTAALGVFAVTLHSAETTELPRLRSGVEVVALTVTVQGQDGSFPSGLAAEDFQVFENGVPQTISFFDAGTAPVDVVLLIDASVSMTHVLPSLKRAATTLVTALGPDDRAAVITFGGGVRQRAPLTTDHARVTEAIQQLSATGTTPLFDALYVSLRTLNVKSQTAEVRRRAVVVFTDGDDTASVTSFDSLLELAREAGINVYTVTFKGLWQPRDERGMRNDYQMRALASETGARALVALEASHLDPLYKQIAHELAHQYSLGYVPVSTLAKHQFARIAVAVRGRNLNARTRSGYVAGQ